MSVLGHGKLSAPDDGSGTGVSAPPVVGRRTDGAEPRSPHRPGAARQVVVLTGASSGIRLPTARLAAQRGAGPVLAARNEEALRPLCDEIDAGRERRAVGADVPHEEDVARIAETAITEFGRFDTWVDNAAVPVFGETRR